MSNHPVHVLMPDGTTEEQLLDSFVNAQSAAIEAMRPAPPLYKARLVPVIVEPSECVRVDSKSYIKASARNRIANAAGVQQHGEPRVEEFTRDGVAMTRVTVALVRPPMYPEPQIGMAEGAVSECRNAKERQFFLAKLHTQAHTRALKKVLADDFAYDPQEISAKGGRFLVASVTPDENDPEVRAIHLERMRQASALLYPSSPPVAALPSPDLPDDDVLESWEADDTGFSGMDTVSGDEAESGGTSASLPDWCKSFARDRLTQEINWESLPQDKVKDIVRKAIKDTGYPVKDDPADVVSNAKGGYVVAAAKQLYRWQMEGGVADA